MEYEKLTYTNSNGESITLSVNSRYHCNVSNDVTGLADITNTLYTSNSMGQHGDTYIGQRIEPRDIEITGNINTTDKAQAIELRRKMSRIFNPELEGTLTYEYGDYVKKITCRTDSSPQFSRKKVFYQFDITLSCLNPFWQDENEAKEDIASWVAAWQFPCEIDRDDEESMIFGYREESVIVDCTNEGDVSTGMRIRFTALGTVVTPVLLNVETQEYMQINATMETGDVIEVDTQYGNKTITLTRNGVETNYYRYMDVDSTFMQLDIGSNIFRYDAEEGVNNMEVSIFYTPKYLGV